jgi:hypothetical protein
MPGAGKAASWYFLTENAYPELYDGEILFDCDSMPESKIFQLEVIFTQV